MARLPPSRSVDLGLSALLAVQALTLFVVIPLGGPSPTSHLLFDACHLVFAAVCVAVLTGHRVVQCVLLAGLVLLAAGPGLQDWTSSHLGLDQAVLHDVVGFTAFVFNGVVTALVARHVFGPGRVTAHRVQGAILIYLNVAALFAIAYSALESHVPGAIVHTAGGVLASTMGARIAELTYFSIATITTTGYGDLAPVHFVARSLANLEAVFGQLFPATLLARLVALHLAHGNDFIEPDGGDDAGTEAGREHTG